MGKARYGRFDLERMFSPVFRGFHGIRQETKSQAQSLALEGDEPPAFLVAR
jgi:hypothetical protein